MRFSVLTLFPDMYGDFLHTSIIGRCIVRGIASVDLVQIRDFARDRYRHVDDTPFGGGAGMVMKCQPLLDALDSVRTENTYTVLMSPSGHPYTQKKAHELAQKEHVVLICGHYEGVDARVLDHVDESISIGDYVLTGGELASMCIMDSVIRLLDGSIKGESTQEESYENDLLEYPQYTKPAEYNGVKVPEVLLSGHHENIRKWRLEQSLRLTREIRPDLLEKHSLTEEEKKILRKIEEEQNGLH
ncbi:MAG: tRNA (guanosine(37)-N1)-methyltransferase TrmD [Solobacterium sp.]|nr:tRNA (guanosine(37)-N1)-methyltransferase TrmD [Solobacterium sp.]